MYQLDTRILLQVRHGIFIFSFQKLLDPFYDMYLQSPDDNPAIDASGADLCDATSTLLKAADSVDGVLVHSLELGIIRARLALEIHLPEHVQCTLLALIRKSGPALRLQGASQLPARLVALEAVGLAVVSRSDDLILGAPDQRHKGQDLGADAKEGARGLLGAAGVDDGEGAVVGGKGEGVSRWRKRDAVDPACGVVQVFAAYSVEGEALSPR